VSSPAVSVGIVLCRDGCVALSQALYSLVGYEIWERMPTAAVLTLFSLLLLVLLVVLLWSLLSSVLLLLFSLLLSLPEIGGGEASGYCSQSASRLNWLCTESWGARACIGLPRAHQGDCGDILLWARGGRCLELVLSQAGPPARVESVVAGSCQLSIVD